MNLKYNKGDSEYGNCSNCGAELVPVWFTEEEFKVKNGNLHYTGRKRRSCSHLECRCCFKKACVDDTFDGDWY